VPWVPQRGDVVWVTMGPRTGHEQSGRRPALVLSPGAYNAKAGLAILCPVASRVKGYPFEVAVPDGLPVAGVILADQVKSLDWRAREAELLCEAPQLVTDQVLQKLGALLAS
jgi:mRNA interferase MazF